MSKYRKSSIVLVLSVLFILAISTLDTSNIRIVNIILRSPILNAQKVDPADIRDYFISERDSSYLLSVLTDIFFEKKVIREKIVESVEKINPKIKTIDKHYMLVGKEFTLSEGKPGLKYKRFKLVYENDLLKNILVLEERIIKKPVSGLRLKGIPGRTPSSRKLKVRATAYAPGERCNGPYNDGLTSMGLRIGPGIVAVDPGVIPYGARLYIEGYGYGIAADCGSAIQGTRVDLCFRSVEEALKYGIRNTTLYILD